MTLTVRVVYLVPADQRGVRYSDELGAQGVADYARLFREQVRRNTGYSFAYTVDTIFSPLTLAEIATNPGDGIVYLDGCGQGAWENQVWHAAVHPFLKTNYGDKGLPFFTETAGRRDYRIVCVMKQAGGWAGGRTSITATENAGEALIGDWGLYRWVLEQEDPCNKWPRPDLAREYTAGTFCHEALHGFGVVDVHDTYIGLPSDPFDERQRATLLENSAAWLFLAGAAGEPEPPPPPTLPPEPPPPRRRKGRKFWDWLLGR